MLLIPGLFLACIAVAAVVIYSLIRLLLWLDTNREDEQPTVPSTKQE